MTTEQLRAAVQPFVMAFGETQNPENPLDCAPDDMAIGDALDTASQPSVGDLRRLAEALAAAPEDGGWRDIASVPKDGTRVLLGRFSRDPKDDMDGFMAVDRWKKGFDGFGSFNTRYWPATHWRKLPEPPQ